MSNSAKLKKKAAELEAKKQYDKALEIYTKLKSANHISVALERNGTKVTKDYNIR